jgi:hypothetical protein
MKSSLAASVFVVAALVTVPTFALATSRHHHRHAVPMYSYGNPNPHGYPIAPYGYATPSYSSRYGTYPSWTYDPDPGMRAQLRSEFNRGVEFPGNGR